MDNELKQYLEGRCKAIDQRFETVDRRFDVAENQSGNHFDTISGRFETTEARFRNMLDGRLDALEERMKDHTTTVMRDSETRILSAFHGWARSMEIRVSGVVATVTGFDERLALI